MLPIEEEHFRHLLPVKNDAFPFLDPPVSPPATKRTPVSFGVLTALKPPLVAPSPWWHSPRWWHPLLLPSDIRCYHFHGIGHMQRDCLSQWAYITTDNGGCIKTSDVEDEDAATDNDHTLLAVLILQHTSTWPSLFHECSMLRYANQIIFIVITCLRFSSSWRTAKHVSSSMEEAVTTWWVLILSRSWLDHTPTPTYPYHIQSLNDSGKSKVTQTWCLCTYIISM
jgi:hypothetical protein